MRRQSIYTLMILSLLMLFSCDECEPCPTVTDNNPPSIPVITASATTVESEGQVNLTATSTDQDGDPITYLWDATSGSYNTTSGSAVVWTAPEVDNDQTYTITVEAKDDNCGTASTSVNILVTATGGGNGGNGSDVIIGSDDHNMWAPFGGAAETYKLTQVLYYANEIGKAGIVNGIATMVQTSNSRNFTNLKIYLVHVNRNTIEANIQNNYDGNTPTLVFQQANLTYGDAATDKDQWHDFNFNSNFNYNGADNLLVIFERNSPGGGGSAVGVYGYDTPGINRIMSVSNPANETGIPHDDALYIKLLFQ